MASDPTITRHVQPAIEARGFEHRHFFGGDAWFLNDHFAIGVYGDELVCRIGVEAAEAAMADGVARPMDVTGRPMKGWVFVEREQYETSQQIEDWMDQVEDFVGRLPAKVKKPTKAEKARGAKMKRSDSK